MKNRAPILIYVFKFFTNIFLVILPPKQKTTPFKFLQNGGIIINTMTQKTMCKHTSILSDVKSYRESNRIVGYSGKGSFE